MTDTPTKKQLLTEEYPRKKKATFVDVDNRGRPLVDNSDYDSCDDSCGSCDCDD